MKYTLKLNFYGFKVLIEAEQELIKLLQLDFHYFVDNDLVSADLKLYLVKKENLEKLIPFSLIATKQSLNSMTYNQSNIRYNDYYGEAVSIFDYSKEECHVYAKEINRLHEISYLIILSRQGKWSDLKGIHKIHAMSVSKDDKSIILMLPMKGGKSTLFTQFLNKEEFNLISDDSPMVTRSGKILPFPIRFGLEDQEEYKNLLQQIPEEYKSTLQRKQYGTKILVDMMAYGKRVGHPGKKLILIQGKRHNSSKTVIKKIGFFRMYNYLVTNLVVGIGLPMIIEYFLESSFKDKINNIRILFSRLVAAFFLAIRSQNYLILMGNDKKANADIIEAYFFKN